MTIYNNKFSTAVTLLQRLIATPSFSGSEHNAADVVQKFFADLHIDTHRKGNNVWCFNKYPDPVKPTILLNSHLDTVVPNECYTKDPFCPEICDGKLFGLGSNDAGGCLVSLISAFQHFYWYRGLPFNLCLAATAEEENSGMNGIQSVLPELGQIDAAIVGEPTQMQIAVAEKGNMVIDCIYSGKPGHAAREEGVNAIYKCLKDIEWFDTYRFPQIVKEGTPVKMTVTQINAGTQHNIVPAKCMLTVDIRFDDSYTKEQIITTICEKTNGEISVRPGALNASSIRDDHPLVKAGMAQGCKTYISPTSSDLGWLTVPAIKMGPGNSARSHSADEFIMLEEIKKGIDLYIKLLEGLPLSLINNIERPESKVSYLYN
jgi:acetylornithine deacetylase